MNGELWKPIGSSIPSLCDEKTATVQLQHVNPGRLTQIRQITHFKIWNMIFQTSVIMFHVDHLRDVAFLRLKTWKTGETMIIFHPPRLLTPSFLARRFVASHLHSRYEKPNSMTTWHPNDPCFDWKRSSFGGQTTPKKQDKQLPGIQYLANDISPNLDFSEIRGFPFHSYILGAQVVWGCYNLTSTFHHPGLPSLPAQKITTL